MPGPAAVRLRRARLADAPAIARVMRAAVRAAPGPYRPAERAAWGSLPALYHRWAMTAGGEDYVIAERNGRAVGYAALRGAEVTALFVLPRAAGAGIGAALLARLVARARAAGAGAVRVDAAAGAAPFYAAQGFRPGRALRVPLPGGRRLQSVRMVLKVAPTTARGRAAAVTSARTAGGTRTAGTGRARAPSGTRRGAPRSRRGPRAPPSSR